MCIRDRDKEELMADREVISTRCYLCHKNLRRKVRWFTPNGRHYYSLSYCDKHGWMKGKIRIKKAENDMVYACLLYTSRWQVADNFCGILPGISILIFP